MNTVKFAPFKKRTDDSLAYARVHQWLTLHYGKATKCENKKCPFGEKHRFEWSLKVGMKYARDRKRFKMLCRGCHRKMDGNNNPPAGERQWCSKLTKIKVLKIRSLYKTGLWSQIALGKKFGVRQDNISRIVNRIYWKHI